MRRDPAAHFDEWLRAQAAERAGSPALIHRGREVTWAELQTEADAVASAFARLGIGAGDRVGLWMPNVPAWLAIFLASARLGAVVVAINTRFRAQEVADILERSGCKTLVYWPGFRDLDFEAVLGELPAGGLSGVEFVIGYSEAGDRAPSDPMPARITHRYRDLVAGEQTELPPPANHPCIVFTTSGTTRKPKFVLHDQTTLLRHAHDCARAFGYRAPGSRVVLTVPLCGVFGFCTALAALEGGAPLVMNPVFDARAQADQMERQAVTHFIGPSAALEQLLNARPGVERPFPSLREAGFASFSPTLGALPERARAAGITLVGLYGSSEVQALAARQPADAPEGERLQGGGTLVAPEGRVRAVDPATRTPLPHGTPGELEFNLPSRMRGYLGDEAATEAAFSADGYFRSGDLGATLDQHRFVFLARMGDALRLGGYLVSPAEIEAVVEEAAGVTGCQVVGVTSGGSHRAVAIVTLAGGARLDEAAVISHCAAILAKYKVPIRVLAVDGFPVAMGPNGTKIQKNRLQEFAQAMISGQPAPMQDAPPGARRHANERTA